MLDYVRLGCTGQDLMVSTWLPFPKSFTLFIKGQVGLHGMANVCALPSAF